MRANNLAIVIVFIALLVISGCEKAAENNANDLPQQAEQNPAYPITLNIKANQSIHSPFIVETKSNNQWMPLEGELGFVEALAEDGTELGQAFLITEDDWMSGEPVKFYANLEFTLEKTTKGLLVFTRNTVDDDEQSNSFSVPVVFTK